MATQATEQVTRTVTARVENVGEVKNDKVQFKFQVDAISKFPLPMSVPSEDAEHMKPGESYAINVARGRLKDGKQGQYDNEYWWDWQGFADPDAAPTPQAPATPPQSAVQRVQVPNEREDRSDRRTALMQAVKVLGLTADHETLEFAADATEWLADRFFAWICNEAPAVVQEAINAGGVVSPDDLPFDLDGGPPA
jgi:hypothetical protein